MARGASFADAFATSFRDVFAGLADLAADHALWTLGYDLARARGEVAASLDRLRGTPVRAIGGDDAVELTTRYALYAIYRDVLPRVEPLRDQDRARRYEVDDDVRIATPDGAAISAIVVRPRWFVGPQPAVLFFTIYTDRAPEQAYLSAARGYVGVTAFPRGKWRSTGAIVPYERDAVDTRAAIEWISRQPWCDGRVAMYGGSYAGFTQWAALKHPHPALKTIVPYVAAIPGQGLPMENNVFISPNYGWAFYVSNDRLDDAKVYFDPARWNALPGAWFASGRPYREIDRVDGTPNPLLQRWLRHPAYDAYWQAMVPYGADFARIDIPILTVTGYYDDGQISALRYFLEHTRHRSDAPHYLLIGPYDHFGAQRRPSPVLRGYAIDPVARIDVTAITFGWIDHVLRGGAMPALLADRVNYEVMGANEWRHAPSIERMHDAVATLYLDDHKLTAARPSRPGFIAQEVDLADRKTENNQYYPDPIVGDALDDGRGVVFVGEPLAEPMSIDGIVTGEMHAVINKRDLDVGVELYERTPDGKYVALTYYLGRASYARDMTVRRLLTPGRREVIPFERLRMVSRQLSRGSQLVVVVNVNKNAFAQVNHGTGKDVSDESVADAGAPLRIRWYGDSFLRIPIRK
jgi:putative CocE/NonD family hydrolase